MFDKVDYWLELCDDDLRTIAATTEFKEMNGVRSKARHDEAQAIYYAEQREAKYKRKQL